MSTSRSRWLETSQQSRERNFSRSSTNHATRGLDEFSIRQEEDSKKCEFSNGVSFHKADEFTAASERSHKRRRSRSASPTRHPVDNASNLTFQSLPPFKKKPGRSFKDLQSARESSEASTSYNEQHAHPNDYIEEHTKRMCCPSFLAALNGFQELLEASQNGCQNCHRQITNLYARLKQSEDEIKEFIITVADLRRNINMLANDRRVSDSREAETAAKNTKLVESIERLIKEQENRDP